MVLHTAIEYYSLFAKKLQNETLQTPHFVTTTVEHDAVLLPLRHYEAQQLAGI